MEQKLYAIYEYHDLAENTLIARDMTLDTALVVLRALIESYYNEKIRYIVEPE